jgi:tight adherence protein C
MDLIAALSDLLADDAVVFALMAVPGAIALGLLAFSFLQSRFHVRRRAAEGLGVNAGSATAAAPGGGGAERPLDRLMSYVENNLAGGDEKEQRLLRMRLTQAGFFDQRAVPWFFAIRLCAAVVFGVGGVLLLPFVLPDGMQANIWMWSAGSGIAGYFAPNIVLGRIIAKRVLQNRMGFPDFMDLMVVCAEAGLTMEASIDRIARELVDGYPSLAENLYMASLEIRAGKPFTEALERLGKRLGIDEATMLATLLQQSAELGTSLSQSLRVYSDEMRHKAHVTSRREGARVALEARHPADALRLPGPSGDAPLPRGDPRHGSVLSRASRVAAVQPDAGRGEIEPHPVRPHHRVVPRARRDRRGDAVGELHERRVRMHQRLGGPQELEPLRRRLGEEGQAGQRRAGGILEGALEGCPEIVGIPLDDGGFREPAREKAAELRIVLHENEPVLRDAAPDQRVGHRAGARAKLDDGPGHAGIDVGRHRAGQHLAGGRESTGDQRPLEPGAQESRLVLEPLARLQLARSTPL